jgi:chromosomal replication initiation ATPase DnaA
MTQLILDFGHRPAFGAADFLVAPSNAEAVTWLDRWPDWPSPALAIYGPPGCGKTHLARVFAARSAARLVTAESLVIERLPEILATARAFVVDDADRAPARAMLHLYNLLAERGGHLLVASRDPPARWKVTLDDLHSRLAAAPAVAVSAPDDALLAALLVKLFADRQVEVSEDVVLYLVTRMERSFEAARQMVADLDTAALAERRSITVKFASAVLQRS